MPFCQLPFSSVKESMVDGVELASVRYEYRKGHAQNVEKARDHAE